ncbi:MAG: diguanylate cyclase [Acidobacteria bacterium]|nr:diguanylate cyclase [Acidobacteriota bacterium]
MRLSRENTLWLAPTALLALALVVLSPFERFMARGLVGPPLEALLFLAALGAAALHRPTGHSSLGFATLLLPAAYLRLGVVAAALVATLASLGAEAARRALEKRRQAPLPERRGAVRVVAQASLAGLAALAGGAVWIALGQDGGAVGADGALARTALACAAGALLPEVLFEITTRRALRAEGAREIVVALAPLAADLPGWAAGALAVAVARTAGWTLAAAWLAVATLLVLEAARQEVAASANARRLAESERLSRAGAALAAGTPALEQIALSIRGECRGILPFAWFQLELAVPDLGRRSFAAAEGGDLYEGEPQPPPLPPALPGIHRREPWLVLERALEADGEALGTVRLWCDPRRVEARAVPLFDSLLPSMAASVRGALLDRQARVDRLTGAATRRAFEQRLVESFAACREHGRELALVVADLDHFKRINDTFGHPAGDRALRAVARVLVGPSRGREMCARWGGEEFVLLLEDTSGETALEIAERLRRRIEAGELELEGERVHLSMSFGVAAFPELSARTPEELMALADAALYAAKRLGRNLALLDLGRGRLRTGSGRLIEIDESLSPPETPVFFA